MGRHCRTRSDLIGNDADVTGADASEQFEQVANVAPLVERWLAETRAPRRLAALLDLVEEVRPDPGTIGADLGAYGGAWASQIAERYGCRMTAVDIASSPLAAAEHSKLRPVNADLQQLPFRAGSLSLVWCRDTFSMVADVRTACVEIARVLRRGAGAVIYTAVTTPRLEPLERAELIEALTMPGWWTDGRGPIDDAVAGAGLDVVLVERRSPEHQESALLDADPELLHDLAVLGRFERELPALEALTSSMLGPPGSGLGPPGLSISCSESWRHGLSDRARLVVDLRSPREFPAQAV